jgi:hypothetical protein
MSFPQIRLVLFMHTIDRVATSKSKIDEPHLLLTTFAESQQQVGAFNVGVDVLLGVDIFQNVNNSQ